MDIRTLTLRTYPEPVLLRRAAPVPEVTDEVRAVAERMLDIMDEHEGIGLAAPQVGLSWRMFVLDVPAGDKWKVDTDPPGATSGPMVFINPELSFEGAVEPFEEGCLSLPEVRGDVLRPPVVRVSALNERGERFTLRAGGLLSRCIQHETDHLDGVLIMERMTPQARLKNRALIKDLSRDAERGDASRG